MLRISAKIRNLRQFSRLRKRSQLRKLCRCFSGQKWRANPDGLGWIYAETGAEKWVFGGKIGFPG
jgi:hypothetical protein